MNAEVMRRVYLELPPSSLRTVADLVKMLGGQLLEEDVFDERYYVVHHVSDNERVSRMLKGARVRACLTQKALATLIGVPQSHISEYEKNKRRIPRHKAERLAEVLETVPTHFIYND